MGVFTPANNTAIMTSAPTRQAGVAGGVLNLTRGVGTSLGVALTGLVLNLAAGGATGSLPAALMQRGFTAAVLLLAATAAAASAIAALRGDAPSAPSHATSKPRSRVSAETAAHKRERSH